MLRVSTALLNVTDVRMASLADIAEAPNVASPTRSKNVSNERASSARKRETGVVMRRAITGDMDACSIAMGNPADHFQVADGPNRQGG